MKKLIIIVISLFTIDFVNAQYVVIPDAHFVIWLNTNIPSAMNGNFMDTTNIEVLTRTSIVVENDSIIDISGIQYFSSLKTLNCGNGLNMPNQNSITFLPPLPNNLDTLICGGNLLINLPELPNMLKVLKCYHNHLTELPFLPNSLKVLNCDYNSLPSLPALPDALENLSCRGNFLTNLPPLPSSLKFLTFSQNQVSSLTALPSIWRLECDHNQLSTFPTLPNSIYFLKCNNNLLTTLPELPSSLAMFECQYNQLTSLPALPSPLLRIQCDNNMLTSFPVLPLNLNLLVCYQNQLINIPDLPNSLKRLACSNNQLTNLPVLPDSLELLWCSHNAITCLPNLPNTLINSTNLSILNNSFSCLPNYVPAMNSATLAYPLCIAGDTINNLLNCNASSGITGYIYTDNNSNCIKDSSDESLVNVHEILFDSINNLLGQTFSSINGIYDFPETEGTYTIKIDTVNVPFIVQCANPGIDSTITLTYSIPLVNNVNFNLNCKPGFDVGVQSVITNDIVFPGQSHCLRIVAGDLSHWYHLNCADGITGQIQVTVLGPVSYLGAAVGSLTPIISGSTFTYSIPDFGVVDNAQDFGLLFNTDTTAQTGDVICVIITVNPIVGDNVASNNIFKNCYYVVNSHDPNMKEVYPVNVEPGYNDYFTYTIHFQNTGTAPAFNIRLVDTLNTNLDLETFQVTNYSHYNIISIKNNELTVRFPNIQLPDSTSNFGNSKGFFQYRIKPKANLILGTQIKNTANIYFDYNTAVVTNTTINEYVQSVYLYKNNIITSFKIYPNPTSNNITIEHIVNATQDYVISIKNIQGQEVVNEKINFTKTYSINVSTLCNGVYFLSIQNETENNKFKIIIQR